MPYCRFCGIPIGQNDRFCVSCGARQAPGEPVAQTELPAQQRPVPQSPAPAQQQPAATQPPAERQPAPTQPPEQQPPAQQQPAEKSQGEQPPVEEPPEENWPPVQKPAPEEKGQELPPDRQPVAESDIAADAAAVPRKKRSKLPILLLVALVVLAGVCAVIYFLLFDHEAKPVYSNWSEDPLADAIAPGDSGREDGGEMDVTAPVSAASADMANLQIYGFVCQQGDWVYYLHSTGGPDEEPVYSLRKRDVDGTQEIVLAENTAAQYINVSGDWCYYYNAAPGEGICRVKIDGSGQPEALTTEPVSLDFFAVRMTVYGDYIYYFNNDGMLVRMRNDAAESTVLPISQAAAFTIHDDRLYYLSLGDQRVYSAELDGTGLELAVQLPRQYNLPACDATGLALANGIDLKEDEGAVVYGSEPLLVEYTDYSSLFIDGDVLYVWNMRGSILQGFSLQDGETVFAQVIANDTENYKSPLVIDGVLYYSLVGADTGLYSADTGSMEERTYLVGSEEPYGMLINVTSGIILYMDEEELVHCLNRRQVEADSFVVEYSGWMDLLWDADLDRYDSYRELPMEWLLDITQSEFGSSFMDATEGAAVEEPMTR